MRARTSNNWGTVPSNHNNALDVKCDQVPYEFSFENNKWFNYLRSELYKNGRFFLDIPFKTIASCYLSNLTEYIFGSLGLDFKEEHLELSTDKHLKDVNDLFDRCL